MNIRFKKPIFAVIFIFFAFAGLSHAEKIMVVVNKDIITESELEGFIQFTKLELFSQYEGAALEKKLAELRTDALKRLIENKLFVQEAKRIKMEPNKKLINRRIDEIRSKYPTVDAFHQALYERGMTLSDIEKRMGEQLLISQFIDEKFRSSIIISPTEIPQFYQEHQELVDEPQKRRVAALIIPGKESLENILETVKTETDFNKIAAHFQVRLVDLGLVIKGEMRKEFDWAAFLLATPGICPYVEVDGEYYLLKVEEIIPARKLPLDEAQARIKELIFADKIGKKINEWLENEKAKSYIVIKG